MPAAGLQVRRTGERRKSDAVHEGPVGRGAHAGDARRRAPWGVATWWLIVGVPNPVELTAPAPSGRRTLVCLEIRTHWNALGPEPRARRATDDTAPGKTYECHSKGNHRPPK